MKGFLMITKFFPFASAVILALVSSVSAQSNLQVNLEEDEGGFLSQGWYVSVAGVYGEAQDDFDDILDPFLGLTVAIGFNLDNSPLALELEFGYQEADIDIPFARGDVTSTEIMFNARLDFELSGNLDWYVGAGIGWSEQELDASIPGVISVDADANGFTWQLRAGLAIPLNEGIDLFGGVRYIVFEDDDIDDEILSLEFGLRFYF